MVFVSILKNQITKAAKILWLSFLGHNYFPKVVVYFLNGALVWLQFIVAATFFMASLVIVFNRYS